MLANLVALAVMSVGRQMAARWYAHEHQLITFVAPFSAGDGCVRTAGRFRKRSDPWIAILDVHVLGCNGQASTSMRQNTVQHATILKMT